MPSQHFRANPVDKVWLDLFFDECVGLALEQGFEFTVQLIFVLVRLFPIRGDGFFDLRDRDGLPFQFALVLVE